MAKEEQGLLKHIKKKTVKRSGIWDIVKVIPELKTDPKSLIDLKFQNVKDKVALLIMENGDEISAFFYNDKGNASTIPLANPVLIYFHNAQGALELIYEMKEKLLSRFRKDEVGFNEEALQTFYGFFGLAANYTMMLMTALEAFINQKIPQDYIYNKPEGNKFVRSYNNEQIQRWLTLEDKIKILKSTSKTDFTKSPRYVKITQLKELRDDIVHTKVEGKAYNNYKELFVKTLNFKYNETIRVVQDFINFYEDGLIEQCTCGVDG